MSETTNWAVACVLKIRNVYVVVVVELPQAPEDDPQKR